MNAEEKDYIDAHFKAVDVKLKLQDMVLDRIDHTVNGNGKPGLKITVDRHEKTLKFAKRVGWIILTPVLGAAGTGLVAAVVYLIRTLK